MQRRISEIALGVAIAGLAGMLLVAPPSRAGRATHSAARGCASLAGVTSFHGHAAIAFHSTASGGFPGTTESETIALARSGYNLTIMVKKTYARGPYVFFTGRTSGGAVKVEDTLTNSNSKQSASQTYDGTVSTTLPNTGTELVFDLVSCKYVFMAHYSVRAKYGGDDALRPYDIVSASAIGEREHIPSSLHLVGGAGPDAGGKACDDPVITGQACYGFTGGWSVEFAELYRCHSVVPTGGCATNGTPTGTAQFIWVLFPTYAK